MTWYAKPDKFCEKAANEVVTYYHKQDRLVMGAQNKPKYDIWLDLDIWKPHYVHRPITVFVALNTGTLRKKKMLLKPKNMVLLEMGTWWIYVIVSTTPNHNAGMRKYLEADTEFYAEQTKYITFHHEHKFKRGDLACLCRENDQKTRCRKPHFPVEEESDEGDNPFEPELDEGDNNF